MRIIFLLGGPGSGKGTQARFLKSRLGFHVIGVGDLLRDHVREKTDLGLSIASTLNAGGFVDDDVVVNLVSDTLRKSGRKDIIFDGFPRNLYQAKSFYSVLQKGNLPVSSAIFLELSSVLAYERLVARIFCKMCRSSLSEDSSKKEVCPFCGSKEFERRHDDDASVIKTRILKQDQLIQDVLKFFRNQNLLHTVKGEGPPEEIFSAIQKIIKDPRGGA